MREYAQFDVMDFVLDEYFQQWVKFSEADHTGFFENFLSQYPEKREVITEARILILLMDFQRTAKENKRNQSL